MRRSEGERIGAEIELRTNSQQHWFRIEREPARPGAARSSTPVRQLDVTGYRGSETVTVMLGDDIHNQDRAVRLTLHHHDLAPFARALLELSERMTLDIDAAR